MGVLLVHAVNPWGMAWGRRQNESNVDLNRNWRRSETDPVHNEAYDELHALAWVYRHGDRDNREHAAAAWAYRCCFTPVDRDWETMALDRGAAALDRAVAAVEHWRR